MAFAKVFLKNPRTGQMREAPVGFSWTTFFFGFFPALLRSDWIGAAVQFILAMLTAGFSNLFFMFAYNKWHLKRLVNEGYEVTGSTSDIGLIEQRLSQQLPRLSPA